MKKLFWAGLLCAMVCADLPCKAGTLLDIDIPKVTLTEQEAEEQIISGFLK